MSTNIQEQALPPVPSAQVLTSTGQDLISQPWNQWFINLRTKVNTINELLVTIGGASTPLAAFDTLSPLTTTGDMLTYNGGHNVRLPIGTSGQILAVVSGLPTWVNPSASSSPLTTKGDVYGYDTAPARIPVGTDSYVLTADSTVALGVSWKPAGTPTLPITTKGDILGYGTAPDRIPVGTNGQVLSADSTTSLGVRWITLTTYTPPVTTKGDLFGFAAAPARVPVGTNGQVLTADSTNANGVSWKTPTAGGMTIIASGTLGASASNIVISSIPGTFNHLQLIVLGLTVASGAVDLLMQFNGDTTSNYAYMENGVNTAGSSGNAGSASATSMRAGHVDSAASNPGLSMVDIPFYALTTNFKHIQFRSSNSSNMGIGGAYWKNAAAVISITIFPSSSTFAAGAQYILYGYN